MGYRDFDIDQAQDLFIRQRERELLVKFESPMGSTVAPMWARETQPISIAVDWAAWVNETDPNPDWTFAEVVSSELMRARSFAAYCYARARAECERKPEDYWQDMADPFERRAA